MIRFLIGFLILAVVPFEDSIADESVSLEVVPQVELDLWRPRWTESFGELQSMMGDILDSETFSGVDAASKSAALTEFNAELEKNFSLAAQNIAGVDVLPAQGINVYDILRREKLVLTKAALEALEARFK